MDRPVVALSLLLLALAVSPAAAQTVEELETKIEALTRRVEALERGNASARRPQATASQAEMRKAAEALYRQVDVLLGDGKPQEALEAVAAFEATHRSSNAAAVTRSLRRELDVVGRETPDWTIDSWYQGETDLDGAPTVLVFWESWCPHCRNEMPRLNEMHAEYGARGLQIVGMTRLTRSATEEAVTQFIADNEIAYPMAKIPESLAQQFNVQGIPAAAVVKDGKIVWRGHPVRLTPALLGKWL
jgi:thiol-disulfide isomerase/thioredoxin